MQSLPGRVSHRGLEFYLMPAAIAPLSQPESLGLRGFLYQARLACNKYIWATLKGYEAKGRRPSQGESYRGGGGEYH